MAGRTAEGRSCTTSFEREVARTDSIELADAARLSAPAIDISIIGATESLAGWSALRSAELLASCDRRISDGDA